MRVDAFLGSNLSTKVLQLCRNAVHPSLLLVTPVAALFLHALYADI